MIITSNGKTLFCIAEIFLVSLGVKESSDNIVYTFFKTFNPWGKKKGFLDLYYP